MLEMQFGSLKVKIKPEHLADFKNKLDKKPRKPTLPKEKRIFPNSSRDLGCTADYVRAYYSLNRLGQHDHFEPLNRESTTWLFGADVEVEELELESC